MNTLDTEMKALMTEHQVPRAVRNQLCPAMDSQRLDLWKREVDASRVTLKYRLTRWFDKR